MMFGTQGIIYICLYRAESSLTKQRASHLLWIKKNTNKKKQDVVCFVISEHAMSCYSHLRLFNYFFFLSWPFNLPCTHLGNFKFLILVSVLVVNMIIKGHYLASMVLLSPSGVKETHQFRWLMMLLCQFPMILQSFCFAAASSFLRRPTKSIETGKYEYNTIQSENGSYP